MLFSHSFTPSSLVNAHFTDLVYTGLERQQLLSDGSMEQKLICFSSHPALARGTKLTLLYQVVMAQEHTASELCCHKCLSEHLFDKTGQRLSVYIWVSYSISVEARVIIYCIHLQHVDPNSFYRYYM